MGRVSRAIFAGVGQGLGVLAQGIMSEDERKRKEERLAKTDAFKERELSLREKESKLNQQRMEIANQQALVKYNHGRYTNALVGADGDADGIANAMSSFLPDSKQYRNRPGGNKKALLNPTTGDMQVPHAVFDIGTFDTDANNEIITGANGKPIFKSLDLNGGEKVFWTPDELENFSTKRANADDYMALQMAKITSKDVRTMDALLIKAKAQAKSETKTGKLKDVKTQAEIDALNRAKTKGTPAQAGVSVRMGLGDEKVERTAKESDNDRAEHAVINKRYSGTTMDDSFKIAQVKSDPRYRAAFAESIDAIIAGTETEQNYLKDARKLGVPVEFARDLLEEARDISDEFTDGDSEGILTRIWNKLFN